MRSTYQDWLKEKCPSKSSAATRLSDVKRVEKSYGDLDSHYDRDELRSVVADLRYTVEDERNNKPNTTKIQPIDGNIRTCLAAYKQAVEWYCKFRRDNDEASENIISESLEEPMTEHRQLIGLERDMQAALRLSIQQLERGLEIIDEGAERIVSSGRIDITAKDKDGALVAIELKTGAVRRSDIGQILSYMGDLKDEEPDINIRGILVAGSFDKKAQAAASMVPNLSLCMYRVNFEFTKL